MTAVENSNRVENRYVLPTFQSKCLKIIIIVVGLEYSVLAKTHYIRAMVVFNTYIFECSSVCLYLLRGSIPASLKQSDTTFNIGNSTTTTTTADTP